MASYATQRGSRRMAEHRYQGAAAPANYFIALCTSASSPSEDTVTLSQLTEIAAGNGYTAGGASLSLNSTDFPTVSEDGTNNKTVVTLKDITWTASGGPIPASGPDARYAVLLGPNETPGSREVLFVWDLGADQSVSSGQPLTLQAFKIEHRSLSI